MTPRRHGFLGGLMVLLAAGCGDGPATGDAVCPAGQLRCVGLHVERCRADGDAWDYVTSCAAGETCASGVCTPGACVPDCAGRDCGEDGCGGSCGACDPAATCSADGLCETPRCVPACAGRECGDDGCGGSCGACDAPDTCLQGECSCAPACGSRICGSDGCGGSCGACPDGLYCAGGACIEECGEGLLPCGKACCTEEETCTDWECCRPQNAVACFQGNVHWIDSCGNVEWPAKEPCPLGCTDGACVSCHPDCLGKDCGDDGCGGSCGTCPTGKDCTDQGLCADAQCACTTGPCCDGCQFLGDAAKCQENADQEVECLGEGCGAPIQARYRDRFCSGHDAGCAGALGPWKDWLQETCATTEACVPDLGGCSTTPVCAGTCEVPEPDPKDQAGGGNDAQAAATPLVEWDGDADPCALAVPAFHGALHAGDDVDWYKMKTGTGSCTFSPVFLLPEGHDNRVEVRCWWGALTYQLEVPGTGNCTVVGPGAVGTTYYAGQGITCSGMDTLAFQSLSCGSAQIPDLSMTIWVRVAKAPDVAFDPCADQAYTVQVQ